jgi:hypothetical protein
VPGILQRIDPSFFLVPELDLKRPSTSLASRKSGIKVDLLTTARTPRDGRSRLVAPLGLAAQPRRFEVLAEAQPGTLAAAARVALGHRDRGLVKDIKRSVSHLPDKTRNAIKALLA